MLGTAKIAAAAMTIEPGRGPGDDTRPAPGRAAADAEQAGTPPLVRATGAWACRRRSLFETVQPIEQRERLIGRRALQHGGLEQPSRFARFAAIERRDAVVQQLLGLALPLGQRAARPLDVGARARMAAIEEQRARPDVDRLFVLGGEVVIEAEQQQLLDLRIAIRVRRAVERAFGIGAKRIRHR